MAHIWNSGSFKNRPKLLFLEHAVVNNRCSVHTGLSAFPLLYGITIIIIGYFNGFTGKAEKKIIIQRDRKMHKQYGKQVGD